MIVAPVRHGLRNLLKAHADWEVLWGSRRRAGRDCKDPALGSRRHCDGLRDAYYRRHRSGTENIERGSNHFNPTFSMYMDSQLANLARHAGISAVLSKSNAGQVVKGIEAMLRGETFCASQI
jgi:hypothetical protein